MSLGTVEGTEAWVTSQGLSERHLSAWERRCRRGVGRLSTQPGWEWGAWSHFQIQEHLWLGTGHRGCAVGSEFALGVPVVILLSARSQVDGKHSSEAAFILHRKGFDCRFSSRGAGLLCSTTRGKVSRKLVSPADVALWNPYFLQVILARRCFIAFRGLLPLSFKFVQVFPS